MIKTIITVLCLFLMPLFSGVAFSADAPYCEVVNIHGAQVQFLRAGALNTLKVGDRLQKGDKIMVGADSSADIAMDEKWENVVHINANSHMLLRFLNPTRLELVNGDLYMKLDNLNGSKFEVATPTAIAAVRGTRYRTVHNNGSTTVFNDSETSLIYVYHLDEHGNRAGRPTVLKPGESITLVGEVEVLDTLPDDLDQLRDLEDQNQLNDDLTEQADTFSSESPYEGGGGYGGYGG